jgi:hypothetical protein
MESTLLVYRIDLDLDLEIVDGGKSGGLLVGAEAGAAVEVVVRDGEREVAAPGEMREGEGEVPAQDPLDPLAQSENLQTSRMHLLLKK